MLRYLLLLVLSAPLFYVAYEQAVALFGLDKPLELPEAALSEPRAALGAPGKRDEPRPEFQAALLAVSDDCLLPRAGSDADRIVGPAFKEHADHLKDVRRLFVALANPGGAVGEVVNPLYKSWIAKRTEVRGLQDEIDKLYKAYLKNPTDRGDLDLKLEAYKKETWRDDSFVTKVEAGMSRREMTDLADASGALEEALAAGAGASSRAEVIEKAKKIIEEREQFLKKFPIGPDATQVRRELAYWKKARELLKVSDREGAARTPSEAKRQLGNYAALLKGSPPEFHRLVRETARRFCTGLIKPMDRDKKVMVGGVEVLREQVQIHWKNPNKNKKQKQNEWLKDSGYDEFTLPTADVEHFMVGATSHEKPIRPTAHSTAARAFNEKLATFNKEFKAIRWTDEAEKALAGLRQTCTDPAYKAYLTDDAGARVEAVHEAKIDHPELFSGRD